MNENIKRAGGIAASAVVALASCGTIYGVAAAQSEPEGAYATEVAKDQAQRLPLVNVDKVEGTFSFTQDTLSSKDDIAGIFNKQVKAFCGARPEGVAEPTSIDEWQISVSGDVSNAFTATVGELAQEETKQTIMTCTCSNNMPGGAAIINASVRGIPVTQLLKQAGIDPAVNTVVFQAADGTETKLPLSYVMGHGALLVYDVNDDDLSATVGGTNQLWIESSAGKYFTRDVVGVAFTAEAEPPAEPTFTPGEFEYANRPNVGIQLVD